MNLPPRETTTTAKVTRKPAEEKRALAAQREQHRPKEAPTAADLDIAKRRYEAMASKADVSSAAKPNKAAATMATGSEVGAGESAEAAVLQQLPPEVWATMNPRARKYYTKLRNQGAQKQGGK